MSTKQDKTYTRTASDLERKYQFGKTFAEMLGMIDESRDHVDKVESSLVDEMSNYATSLTRSTEEIVMAALKEYSKTSDVEEFEQTLRSELQLLADRMTLRFESQTQQITTIDGEQQALSETLQKHFEFTENGLTIKAGATDMRLRIDNDVISFYKGEIKEDDLELNRFGWWDGVDFHTGNIVVGLDERAQFGSYAFVPRSTGSLSFLKVGEK